MKFKIDFTFVSWECGDGCCSDSWVDATLYRDGEHYNDYDELRYINDEKSAKEYAEDLIEDCFDLTPDKYELEIVGSWNY